MSSDILMLSSEKNLEIYPVVYDESGIANWKIGIVEVATSKIVKSFDGFGECPESVKWNGKDFENKYVPDGAYNIELTVTDTFGNIAKSNVCKMNVLSPKIKVEKIDRGLKLSFACEVLFDFDKSNIKSSADKKLREAVRILGSYGYQNLSIEGHTDSKGTEEYNQKLSERRAEAVANYLVKLGIDRDRVSVVGYGESNPVATNETDFGRQLNRRVEIIVLKDKENNEESVVNKK